MSKTRKHQALAILMLLFGWLSVDRIVSSNPFDESLNKYDVDVFKCLMIQLSSWIAQKIAPSRLEFELETCDVFS